MNEKKFMSMAIEEACSGIKSCHGGPFGAVIIRGTEIIAADHNTVLIDNDPTRHAEIKVISLAARKLGTFDLTGCMIYSTTEPCPMCFSAIHWSRIDRLVYGTDIEDVRKLGFNELTIPAQRMKEIGNSPVEIHSGFMRDECEALLRFWKDLPAKTLY